jgi:folate-binding protein YgfZ
MSTIWCEVPRDVVAVRGDDAETFLQGQCSQDVARIDAGASAWSFVLQPTGKVDVLCRIHRVNDHTFVLDTDAGWGQALIDRLQRFKLRVRVDLDRVAWRMIAVRGPQVPPLGPGALAGWWSAPGAVDLLGDEVAPPAGTEAVAAADLERLRIEAGWPVMGHELTSDTIPAESGVVPLAVSFTKGCYTGQELVARIDSRGGNVPRHLRRLRAPAGVALAEGTRLTSGERDVGWVTSVAAPDEGGTIVALGYVARSVEPPATVSVDGGQVAVETIASGT